MIWMLAAAGLNAVQAIGAAQKDAAQAKATNQQIEAYNKATAAQAAKSFTELSIQKAVLADQTEAALFSVQRQTMNLKSQRGLQAAASDTMGASVDQALLDAERQGDEAASTLKYNADISNESLNAQFNSVADSAAYSLKTKVAVPNVWSAALGSLMGSVGSTLIGNKMSTGSFLGKGQGLNT